MSKTVVRRVTAADTAQARALRLEMLADAPLAFLERIDEAAARPHAQFRTRLMERVSGNTSAVFVADAGDRLVGQAGGFAPPGGSRTTLVFAVYVSPQWRGTGLLSELVAAVAAWSRRAGRPVLELEVITGNHRAIRAYQRLGFVDTGQRSRHPNIPILTELRMTRPA
jgi:RimJ/RimL family protein N-acetyltransferase